MVLKDRKGALFAIPEVPLHAVLPLTRFYGMFDTRELIGLRAAVVRGNGRAGFVQILSGRLVAEDLVALSDGSECLMSDLAEAIKAVEKEATNGKS